MLFCAGKVAQVRPRTAWTFGRFRDHNASAHRGRCCACRLPYMMNQLFESFREWVHNTRQRKDSKKPLVCTGSKVPGHLTPVATGVRWLQVRSSTCLEPWSSIGSNRSPEASWLNIKQLTEPLGPQAGELISTSQI